MKQGTVIDPNILDNDESDLSLRPTLLKEFIGQEHVKENLAIFVNSAKKRMEALDHVLLYGPPGLGKTTLAQIMANEMQTAFRMTSGPVLAKSGDLAAIITNLSDNDVLFIDEIHRLNPVVEETLYSAMEDFKLDIIIGEGPAARTVRIDLPKFTLIGATTRLGLLSNPLRDRFGIPIRLKFYDNAALSIIVKRAANILEVAIEDDGADEIAKRSRGTPRIALRLLKRVRDFAIHYSDMITKKLAEYALNKLEVDEYGLDDGDRRYMLFIAENYGMHPVGIDTISAGIAEQRDSIEETIEPFLVQHGFVNRAARGRILTEKAFKHLGIELPKNHKK